MTCLGRANIHWALPTVTIESSRGQSLCEIEQRLWYCNSSSISTGRDLYQWTLQLLHCPLKWSLDESCSETLPFKLCETWACPDWPATYMKISVCDCVRLIGGEYYPQSPVEGSVCAYEARVTTLQPLFFPHQCMCKIHHLNKIQGSDQITGNSYLCTQGGFLEY